MLATAGGQYLQLSSELLTPQGDVNISAANVALRSAPNTTSVLNIVRQRQSGLTLSASHPVIDSLQTGVQMASLARRTDNGRYQAMALLTSGLSIYNNFADLSTLSRPSVADGKATGGWTFSLGLGASSSSFERLTQTSTPVGPAITTDCAAAGSRLVTHSLSHETLANRDVAEGRSWSVAVSVGNNSNTGAMAGSAVGYARIDTDQRSHTASAVVGTVTQTRPDQLPQALANLRAAERAPLAAKLAVVTQRLNELLNKEPPRCSNCQYQGTTPTVDDGKATATATATGMGMDMGMDTAAGSPALQATLQAATAAAIAAPDIPAPKSQADSTTSAWASWNAAVQRLRAEQARLQQSITAVDTKTYQTTTPANTASALHQPLLHTFDRSKATQELQDGVAVTAAFGKAAFKAVGDAADTRTKAKETACSPPGASTSPACTAATAAAAGWEEGGKYKIILHGIVGAISGGQAGALATMTAEAAEPAIGRAIVAAGVAVGTPAYDALMLAAKTAVGGGLGGSAGAAAAFNADANNRQLHASERELAGRLAARSGGRFTQQQIEDAMRLSGNRELGEDTSKGMLVSIQGWQAGIYDPGAVWHITRRVRPTRRGP